MRRVLESLAQVAVIVAAMAVAGAAVRREFFSKGYSGSLRNRVDVSDSVSYFENWESLKRAGTWYGDSVAPVTVVEFMDYECPYCRAFHETLTQAARETGRPVALLLIQYPLPYHRFAKPAAVAAECARKANRFSQMTDLLFAKQDSLGLKSWAEYAAEAGVADANGFGRCLKVQAVDSRLARDIAMADSLQAAGKPVLGTPTVVINGWRYSRPPSVAQMTKVLQAPPVGQSR